MNESISSENSQAEEIVKGEDYLNVSVEEARSKETREALLAIFNLAIFLLLWGGTSVWSLFTDWSWAIKLSVIIGSFAFWGFIVNQLFIRLTYSRPS